MRLKQQATVHGAVDERARNKALTAVFTMRRIGTALALLILPLTSCGATDAITDAVSQIELTQKVIQRESSAWRNELPQLQLRLNSLIEQQQGKLTADAKQILADTSNDVRSLAQETVTLAGLTAEQLTAKFGTEARCNIDFARSRVSADLTTLVERLKFWQQHHNRPPRPPHSVCQITPDNVELRTTGLNEGWSMSLPTDKVVGVYGYNFRSDAVPAVELQDRTGNKLRDSKVSVSYVTQYQLNLNFGSEDFSQIAPGARYVLRWPDQPDPNAISVTLIKPAQLKILDVAVQPSAARARVDLVRAVVDLVNQGGSDTARFVVRWTPGPNDPVQDLSIDSLGAGERMKVTFPGYVYKTAGSFQTDIVVGGGSDSWHGVVNVTPYANTPRLQSVPIRGQWPGGGGESGQTKSDFDLQAIELGADCEIDASRGGGSFEVSDINDDNLKYTIAWPSGYDFGFGGNTFWRSLSSVSANYDAQTRRVTPVVTLKGLGGHGWFATRGPERFDGTFTIYSMCPQ
ncbi:hypothetical protein ACGFI3_25035 [Nonomuraea wenchangensis]|uniref:hypothetical protein n=1 Tax=Nonomuraea wenchangensis TaxID=568860 RepID=UPI003721AD40